MSKGGVDMCVTSRRMSFGIHGRKKGFYSRRRIGSEHRTGMPSTLTQPLVSVTAGWQLTGLGQINLCCCSFDFCLIVISKLTLDLNRQHDGNDTLPTEGSFWPSVAIMNENPSPLLDLR